MTTRPIVHKHPLYKHLYSKYNAAIQYVHGQKNAKKHEQPTVCDARKTQLGPGPHGQRTLYNLTIERLVGTLTPSRSVRLLQRRPSSVTAVETPVHLTQLLSQSKAHNADNNSGRQMAPAQPYSYTMRLLLATSTILNVTRCRPNGT